MQADQLQIAGKRRLIVILYAVTKMRSIKALKKQGKEIREKPLFPFLFSAQIFGLMYSI